MPVTDPIIHVAEELTAMAADQLAPAPYLSHVAKTGVDIPGRRIYLGEIETGTSEWVAQALGHMADRGIVAAELWLNSPGGDVTEMFALHDLIRTNRTRVSLNTVGYGMVASAACLLLACSPHRVVTESCVFMSHESRGFGGDDLSFGEAKDRRKWEDWSHEWWCELMSRYTPMDASWWKRTTERKAEYWLLGGKAIVEAGIADEVLR